MDHLPDILPFRRRLDELDAQMAAPSFYTNPRKATEVSREQQSLRRLLDTHAEYERVGRELAEHAALLKDATADAELRALAQQELPELQARAAALKQAVLQAMIPSEPADSRNTVMEIRAGTGGDEASLFAADLFRLYAKYAEGRGWKIQPMSSSYSDRGGIKEIIFLVTGTDGYIGSLLGPYLMERGIDVVGQLVDGVRGQHRIAGAPPVLRLGQAPHLPVRLGYALAFQARSVGRIHCLQRGMPPGHVAERVHECGTERTLHACCQRVHARHLHHLRLGGRVRGGDQAGTRGGRGDVGPAGTFESR